METVAVIVLVLGFLSVCYKLNRIIALLKEDRPTTAEKVDRRRQNLIHRLSGASDQEIAQFLQTEFGMPPDQKWIKRVIATQQTSGVEAAVTLILEREKESPRPLR